MQPLLTCRVSIIRWSHGHALSMPTPVVGHLVFAHHPCPGGGPLGLRPSPLPRWWATWSSPITLAPVVGHLVFAHHPCPGGGPLGLRPSPLPGGGPLGLRPSPLPRWWATWSSPITLAPVVGHLVFAHHPCPGGGPLGLRPSPLSRWWALRPIPPPSPRRGSRDLWGLAGLAPWDCLGIGRPCSRVWSFPSYLAVTLFHEKTPCLYPIRNYFVAYTKPGSLASTDLGKTGRKEQREGEGVPNLVGN